MKNLKITWTTDHNFCERCGGNWADGFEAYLDGQLIDEFVPAAACFGGNSITQDDAMVRILAKLDIELEIEHE